MANIFSLSHLTLLDCSIAELAFIAARSGYDAISPRLHNMGVDGECQYEPLDQTMLAAARNAIRVTGIKVHDIELARITDNINIQDYAECLEIGAELGASKMVASIWTNDQDSSFVADRFTELCQLGQQFGIAIALEYPCISSVPTLAQARTLIETVQQPNAEILIDTMYLILSRTSVQEVTDLPPEWLSFIQVSDTLPGIPDKHEDLVHLVRQARLYAGEGKVDFTGLIKALPPVNYAIELPNASRIRELGLEGHARRALDTFKQILAQQPHN
jgi:sugar phosphate isomerase/epimerase